MGDPNRRRIAPLFTWRSAIAESALSPTERHVLLALSLYMNERGGSAYPGCARLGRDCNLHKSTVKRALVAASGSGWIRVVHRGGSDAEHGRLATEYVAAFPPGMDREHTATGSGGFGDRSSSARGPVAQGDPITSRITSLNSRRDAKTGAEFRDELDKTRSEAVRRPIVEGA